uniref:Uncharacterized protein n=1 Tax=uncultured prokaryote TaxID=198431 RepID=A0A0H5Q2K7_9ZZZZ|nr:hypothetical protein [uncultured prokaryote]
MDKLTALERELLRSVSDLLTGTEQEIAALKRSLADYDSSGMHVIAQRLSEIERVQSSLHQRMSALEQQSEQVSQQLAEALDGFASRLSGYEGGMRSLSEALNRFGK